MNLQNLMYYWEMTSQVEARGKGPIDVKTKQGKLKHINDVLYVPGLAHNFLSVGRLLEKGYFIVFKDK